MMEISTPSGRTSIRWLSAFICYTISYDPICIISWKRCARIFITITMKTFVFPYFCHRRYYDIRFFHSFSFE